MRDAEVILNFHGIGSPHPGVDAAERPYWIDESFFAAIVDLVANHPRTADFGITFDDGNISDVTIAAPMLQKRGLPGEFFVLGGRLGQPHYLSAADCRALADAGMGIGLHGMDHVDWRALDAVQLDAETVTARAVVAAVAGRPVDSVAIPFGAYNRRVIAHLRHCGFTRIYTSDGGRAGRGVIRNRTSIRADMDIAGVRRIMESRCKLVDRLRRHLSTFVRRRLV